jgi:hypothetical protein
MLPIGKLFRSGVAVALMLTGAAAVARGQVADGGPSLGVGRGMVTITGSVVCSQCNLEEARKAQPYENHFYQLSHRRGRIVMKVTAVDRQAMFESIVWPPLLWVRGEDRLLARLGAEENLFKEMSIVGTVGNSRTLDVYAITIKG